MYHHCFYGNWEFCRKNGSDVIYPVKCFSWSPPLHCTCLVKHKTSCTSTTLNFYLVFVLYFVLCSLWQYSPYHTISSLTSLLKGGGRKQRKCAYCGVFVLMVLSLTSNMWCSAWHIVIVHISYKFNILSIIWNAARNISLRGFLFCLSENLFCPKCFNF